MNNPVIWSQNTIYVDDETGEIISTHKAKKKYIIIKKNKDVKFNYNKTKGHITNTVQCRRQPQLELFTDNTETNRQWPTLDSGK